MARLIDADALIDEMKKWYWDKEKQRAAELDNSPMDLFTNLAIVTVKEQPTAYDVDKVVEELKQEIVWVDAWGKRYCSQQNAIEIVKRGGNE